MVGQLFNEEERPAEVTQESKQENLVVEEVQKDSPTRKSLSLKKSKSEPKYQGKSALLEQQHNPLFGGGELPKVQPVPESKRETFQEICEKIQETYPDNPTNKLLIEKVSKQLSERTHNPFRFEESVELDPSEYNENLMSTVGDFLSDTAKFDDEEIQRSYFEERFDYVQKQLEGMKRSILENTVVSGIGHGMYGSMTGGGEVLLSRMDDVTFDGFTRDELIDNLNDPDKIMSLIATYDPAADRVQWTVADVYDGLITVGSGDINLSTDYDYSQQYQDLGAVLEGQEVKTQEEVNQINIEIFKHLADAKPSLNFTNAGTRAVGAPVSPTDGDLWIDDGTLKYYDSLALDWRTIRSSSPIVHMTDDAPVEADQGDFWFDTTRGIMSIYYIDEDSAQWVSISGYNNQGTTTTIEQLQDQIETLQNRISELENQTTSENN